MQSIRLYFILLGMTFFAVALVTGCASNEGDQADAAGAESVATSETAETDPQISAGHVLKQQVDATITFTSTAFNEKKRIPKKHTCTEQSGNDPNISPPLAWQGTPENSKTIVLIMDSLEATENAKTHWLLWNIPVTVTELPEGVPNTETLADGTIQGTNDSGYVGFLGPCPPPLTQISYAASGTTAQGGKRRQQQQIQKYFFNLYALDIELELDSGTKKEDLLQAIEGHILASGNLVGERQGKIIIKE